MALRSYGKMFAILLLLAALGTTIWWVWGVRPNFGDSLLPWIGRQAPQKNDTPSGSSGTVAVRVRTLVDDRQQATGTARNERELGSRYYGSGLFNESARSLLRSTEIAKIDYGLLRLRTRCIAFPSGGDATTAVKERGLWLARVKGSDALVVGNASEEVRAAGFAQSFDRCSAYFEGTALSDYELSSIRALPAASQALAITRKLSTTEDFNEESAKVALSLAVSGPMFGTLESLVLSKVDYGGLTSSYSQEQVNSLRAFVVEIVLCRMGDDCARGGIVNAQLCWENGICGDNTEEAIWANLRDRGLDTTALNQFVTRVHQALVIGDTSIFRKQKPTK